MNEVIAHAHQVAEMHETRDPFRVCRYENIRVVEQPLLEMRGMYLAIRKHPFIILADDLEPHVRQFVCAHELGHHFRHQGCNRPFMDSRTFMEVNRFENSADKFALHFMLGSAPMFCDTTLTDIELAECLNVPMMLVNSRLIELGVFT